MNDSLILMLQDLQLLTRRPVMSGRPIVTVKEESDSGGFGKHFTTLRQ